MKPLQRPFQGARIRQIVYAVQTAHRRLHRSVEVQLLHTLLKVNRRDFSGSDRFSGRLGEHVLRKIHADHLITCLRQKARHGTGAAGQIQYRMDRDRAFGQKLLQESCTLFILHIFGQTVVPTRQRSITVHQRFSSCVC